MQNFGNYNVNPNTPIYVGGGKKKVKKQSEDKSLGEKVAIGVASTAGAIAAILIGYGIINKFTGNTTKITQDAKKAAEAVVPKAKGAEKKTADIIKGKDSSTQSTYVLLKNYAQQLQGDNMTYGDIQTNAMLLNELAKKSNIKEHGVDLLPLVKQYSTFFNTLLDTYKNQKSTDTVKLSNAEKKSLGKIQTTQTSLLEQIENIIDIDNFFENFKLKEIKVEGNKLKCGNMTVESEDVQSTDLHLHEVCKNDDYTFYLDYADGTEKKDRVNENAFLYIQNKSGKYTKIKLSTIKDKLNQVTEVDEFITTLDGFSIGELNFISKGKLKGESDSVACLTGFTKNDDKKSYAIKLDDLLDKDAAQLKALGPKLTDDILSKIFKYATPKQFYQLMNDDGLKDKLVTTEESPTLTKVGKEIVGAAIKDDQGVVNSGKIAEMLKEIKDLDTAGSVCAAVVDYLIGCDDVTADILNQLLGNESLSGILVTSGDSPTLTEAGKKIVGAAIKDNGTVTSENIVQMLNGLDLKEKVGAAVVNYLIDRNDVTADMLYQLMDDGDLIAKLVEQSGDNAGKLTEVGQKIMNKATEKGLTFAQLFNISQSNPKLEFSYNDDKKSFNIKDRKLIITNLPKTMFYYLQQQQQQQQQQGKDLTLETILFKQYLNEDGIKEYIDESGELKSLGDWDDSYANMDKQNSQVEYNPSELLVNHYVTLVKDSTDSEVKKALEDDASFALQTPTTLGQVLASQDIQDKLITKDTPQKLTEAGKAIVEAAIVYNVQPLSGSKQPSRENIVQMLNGLDLKEKVGAAVVNYLIDRNDVTADMLGQALNNDKLKAKFFNEPTSEGTTTYSLTPAGQHMIKQAAMTYDHDLFVKFVKSLDTENYIECIYETVASMKDDENNTRFQAYWLIAALIQDNSTEKTLKNKLHTIIQDNKGQHFNFSDLNCDDFTEDSQITEDGKLALILFANSKSSDFIGAAKEDTSLGFTSSTITINSFKFRYKIDGTNHTVYYSKK